MREIVKAKHVMLEFNGHDVLNISELSVAENERIGLIGANGSGKTSLLRILSGDMETANNTRTDMHSEWMHQLHG